MMRATGGPLLCIGDLLSDVGEDVAPPEPLSPPSPSPSLPELGASASPHGRRTSPSSSRTTLTI
ncbi:hypothetical protein BT93_K2434 [Corymbia citriodora subsp. variegata]|nr:hypothetical protein BT93_K2434 [Corymbia citriodora subsp. variegata]KAF8008774.1 hypothetical protein BT93_K2434 [Corymbia citriodora subsp. variegata]